MSREWNRQAYDENGKIREDASLIRAIVRVFGFKYMLLAIPSILAVSMNSTLSFFVVCSVSLLFAVDVKVYDGYISFFI